MIPLNVKPWSPVPTALALNEPSFDSSSISAAAAPPAASLLSTADAQEAANDDVAAIHKAIRNPVWIVVIGMACLFGVMALVTSLG